MMRVLLPYGAFMTTAGIVGLTLLAIAGTAVVAVALFHWGRRQ